MKYRIMNRDECYLKLAEAIILSAVDDYRHVLKRLSFDPRNRGAILEKERIERFFHSEEYQRFTQLDCEKLIRRLRAEADNDS